MDHNSQFRVAYCCTKIYVFLCFSQYKSYILLLLCNRIWLHLSFVCMLLLKMKVKKNESEKTDSSPALKNLSCYVYNSMDVAFVTTKVAKETLGVQEDALRKWSEEGLIPCIRTPGNHRRYNISEFIRVRGNVQAQEAIIEEKQSICYCRVSSHGQKEDLERQIAYMQERFPRHRIIRDIGSGINFKRRGLRTILELASKGYISEVVVAYRDRLCRFAYELIEWLLSLHGVKLVVLNQDMEGSESGELAEDLLSIIHVFNCRIQGRRKYQERKNTKEQVQNEQQESR